MNISLNKEKSIGKVLFIVEGQKTEKYLLWKVFTQIFDYQFEAITRGNPYHIYNNKNNPYSKVFVINAEESNIKFINKDNQFLNNLFKTLIEKYDFDIDNASIYYLFDRDASSNTDAKFIQDLLSVMTNPRENDNYLRQGILLLSYPSIESFTLSCFRENSFLVKLQSGQMLKRFLDDEKINQSHMDENSIILSVKNLIEALQLITGSADFDVDDFKKTNIEIFRYEERVFSLESLYNCLSLLVISLIDLGLVEIQE